MQAPPRQQQYREHGMGVTRWKGSQLLCFFTCDFGKFVAAQGKARHHSAEVRQHPQHVVLHPGHHAIIRHGRPAQGRIGVKGRERRGVASKVAKYKKIPVSSICWAGSTATAGDAEQQQQERDEDGGCKGPVVLKTCGKKMG